MELASLRSQMNPHFIFNSLNSIQKYIWDNKQEDASEYLTKFSKLMRLTLEHSMHKLVTLEDELAAVHLYLELEHRRCNNKFDYTVNFDDNINAQLILLPPLLLQPYIENAIWHGLLPKQGRGLLSIRLQQLSANALQCIIEDDGIGRKQASIIKQQKGSQSTSYGMLITQQRLNITEANGIVGSVAVEDLVNDYNEAIGTKIILLIPIETFKKIGNA
jgi:LytS/YehU family sensor histidine kinase